MPKYQYNRCFLAYLALAVLELPGDSDNSPNAVVSPYTLQWAALRRLGVVPHYFFLIRPLVFSVINNTEVKKMGFEFYIPACSHT